MMYSINCRLFLLIIFCSFASWAQGTSHRDQQRDTVLKALNSRPEQWLQPVRPEQVHLQGAQGRVDVNPQVKFSYFAQLATPASAQTAMTLIPLATSRYTPTYYQTDEWWDAHKTEIEEARKLGRPLPKQDEAEVEAWLPANKLSTNPLVFHVSETSIQTQPLQEFLSSHLLEKYTQDGFVVLYRGGEKDGELQAWQSGSRPRGARYWTPTANYAWRYARKNKDFLEKLIKSQAPLFVFKIPIADFKQMTQARWPQLTLGTELTKNAHQAFDQGRGFQDHLYRAEYLGEGDYGVEIEIRANSSGSQKMVRYFKGAVTVENLVADRIQVLSRSAARKASQFPERAQGIIEAAERRVQRTLAEGRILSALRDKKSQIFICKNLVGLLAAIPGDSSAGPGAPPCLDKDVHAFRF